MLIGAVNPLWHQIGLPVLAFFSTMFVAWLLRRALFAEPPRLVNGDGYTLRYIWFIRIVPILGIVVLGTAIFVNPFVKHRIHFIAMVNGDLTELVYFALAFVLMCVLAAEVCCYQAFVTPEGLESVSAWSGVNSLSWDDVYDVYYSDVGQFAVRDTRGVTVRVPKFVRGIKRFCAEVRTRVPVEYRFGAERGLMNVEAGIWE